MKVSKELEKQRKEFMELLDEQLAWEMQNEIPDDLDELSDFAQHNTFHTGGSGCL